MYLRCFEETQPVASLAPLDRLKVSTESDDLYEIFVHKDMDTNPSQNRLWCIWNRSTVIKGAVKKMLFSRGVRG